MQELQPQIAELLRTCVHPPSLLLRVAHVELIDVKYDRHDQGKTNFEGHAQHYDGLHRFTLQYVLTDGELMIQALLHRKLSGLRDAADVTVGDLLDIRKCIVKKSTRLNGQGHIIYLAIEDCHFLLQPFPRDQEPERIEQEPATRESRKRRRRSLDYTGTSTPDFPGEDERAAGFLRPSPTKRFKLEKFESTSSPDEEDNIVFDLKMAAHGSIDRSASTTLATKSNKAILKIGPEAFVAQGVHNRNSCHSLEKGSGKDKLSSTFGARTRLSDGGDEDDGCFEEGKVNLVTVKERRKALQKLDSNSPLPLGSSLGRTLCIDLGTAMLTAKSASVQTPSQHNHSVSQTTSQMLQTELQPNLEKKSREQFAQPSQQASKRDGTFALSQTPTPIPQKGTAMFAPQVRPAPPTAPIQATQQTLLPAPPFHTLRSLRNPPPNQPLPNKNYTLTTLAFISWTGTSLIHRPGSPFPPKRHLKIVDPSLSSSRPPSRDDQPSRQLGSSLFAAQTAFQDTVTVAVYIDATNFKPETGTLALVRGLVMQRLSNGDIILNAYGRLKEQRFDGSEITVSSSVGANSDRSMNPDTHWFITNEAKIRALGYGSKYDYYREWWNEKQRANHNAQS